MSTAADPGPAILQRRSNAAKAVTDAPAEIYRGCFSHILCRTGNFADVAAQPEHLRQDLIVENEVVRVLFERQTLEEGAGKSAVAGVVFREFRAEQNVLKQG